MSNPKFPNGPPSSRPPAPSWSDGGRCRTCRTMPRYVRRPIGRRICRAFRSRAATLADLPVPIVIGHMGYPRDGVRAFMESPAFADLMRLLDGGRCWIKLTGPYRVSARPLPYDEVDALAQTLAKAAPERMLWGTDWPHVMLKGRMPNDGDLCDLIERWMPDATARTRI